MDLSVQWQCADVCVWGVGVCEGGVKTNGAVEDCSQAVAGSIGARILAGYKQHF